MQVQMQMHPNELTVHTIDHMIPKQKIILSRHAIRERLLINKARAVALLQLYKAMIVAEIFTSARLAQINELFERKSTLVFLDKICVFLESEYTDKIPVKSEFILQLTVLYFAELFLVETLLTYPTLSDNVVLRNRRDGLRKGYTIIITKPEKAIGFMCSPRTSKVPESVKCRSDIYSEFVTEILCMPGPILEQEHIAISHYEKMPFRASRTNEFSNMNLLAVVAMIEGNSEEEPAQKRLKSYATD
jgi:hypothetical protein